MSEQENARTTQTLKNTSWLVQINVALFITTLWMFPIGGGALMIALVLKFNGLEQLGQDLMLLIFAVSFVVIMAQSLRKCRKELRKNAQ